MSLFKCKGVIIKTQDYKENDKLVWMYTDELGKITNIARGAKKSKSKLFAVTLPLCYGEYLIFKGKNLYNLQEGKIINSFQGLLNNLDKLTFSSYICELIDIALLEGESNKWLFKEFITTLYLLNTDAIDYEMLIRTFELKLLKATGYGLTLDNCTICKKKISSANYISLSYYGGVCEECTKEHGLYISKGTYNALRFLIKTPSEKIYKLNLSDDIKKEIEKVTTFMISSSYAKRPKSLEMLNYIKE
ncbi:DNA repair protein RecO [Clostridium sp. SHJSY1]|uniref:DNA repair protein RecO n=1 Tax=Clostridium sp. SHJSY1 TaxID=2942483 RepID=UPI0028761DCE|nr:DNA repair protein RecO [Clostridium sp. SHJSY1]MDS0524045.1 DNA repair protein RecO [Clostridium sp. SHJSY1]